MLEQSQEDQSQEDQSWVREISVHQLSELVRCGKSPLLLDVREPFERALCHIGGEFIPAREIPHRLGDLPRDTEIVVYSHTGEQSRDVIRYLQENYGYSNLQNLRGGLLAWGSEIDSAITTY